MEIALVWQGPYAFRSSDLPSIFVSPEADQPGIYIWTVPVEQRFLPYYVGETGKSVAYRHYEHFVAYASGRYSTRDGHKLITGHSDTIREGYLWKKDGWREIPSFVENFAMYAGYLETYLSSLRIFFAPLVAEQRTRRLIEGTLVKSIYQLPQDWRSIFEHGLRTWSRLDSETSISVVSTGVRPFEEMPVRIRT